MVFSSPFFLFLFLPFTLLLTYLTPKAYKNAILLVSSLVFYAWGEPKFTLLLIGSIVINYFIGKWIKMSEDKRSNQLILIFGLLINLGLLVFFKYTNFFFDNLNKILLEFNLTSFKVNFGNIPLPLGISFFTFHAVSFILDINKQRETAPKSIVDLGLYFSLFPHLVAGPIVKYHDLQHQLRNRTVSFEKFSSGVERFIIGLAKKVIIANTLAYSVDEIFTLPAESISGALAWIGLICYTLQIYFDFSGYSDMAIGLARMFGFDFLENFNYPYIAKSVSDFWRRWHISLSSWFREYLYIPLGGNRVSKIRLCFNLLLIYFLTGLWHGASWNFVIWGMIHGVFVVIERMGFKNTLERLWLPLQHLYALLIVVLTRVFFRTDTLSEALEYFKALFNFSYNPVSESNTLFFLTNELAFIMIVGIVLSIPIRKQVLGFITKETKGVYKTSLNTAYALGLGGMFFLSILYLASGTYNPFIYFRF